jgi:putative transcriptional regulator
MLASTTLANQFLIAMPSMRDSNLVRGVVLICQHSSDGAMGVLINRLSEYRLGDVLAQMGVKSAFAEVEDAPVLIGGPVQPERGFVLHSADGVWESSFRVSTSLSVTTSRDVLIAIAEGRGPRRTLITLGYAGWGAGQLEDEIKQNAWLTAEPDERILFDLPLEQRWESATRLLGINVANLSSQSGNA